MATECEVHHLRVQVLVKGSWEQIGDTDSLEIQIIKRPASLLERAKEIAGSNPPMVRTNLKY